MSQHPKVAATDHDVLDVIRQRWSPRAFDASKPLTRDEVHQLFEAARWAPSSGNEQPWQFYAADRFTHPDAFAKLLSSLTESNQTWARSAPVLVLVVARAFAADGKPNRFAWYDAGQAVSMLAIQATSMGLGTRQMAGFHRDRALTLCEICEPSDGPALEPVVIIAIGHIGDAETLPLPRHRETENMPRARRKISEFVTWMTAIAALAASLGTTTPYASSSQSSRPKQYGYKVVHAYPHDKTSFTQGLIYKDGFLYESAGDYEKSNVRKVDLATGKVLQQQKLSDPKMFAEGLTDWQGSLVQLTWQHGQGFFYDLKSLSFQKSFRYSGEGWGLTNDGKRFILSDGVARSGLRFFDPSTQLETGRVIVTDQGAPVANLNELEFVEGEVFANIWHSDKIARIDPSTGHVNGWIDLRGLLKFGDVSNSEGVLNGIAYDAAGKRLFVTGKLWPKLFEITLVPK